jgi:hypothetical protein
MNKRLIVLVATFIFVTLCATSVSAATSPKSERKIGINFASLLGAGDLNFNYEQGVSDKNSVIIGGHVNLDTSTQRTTGENGAYVSYRTYPSIFVDEQGLSGDFLQVTLGINKETNYVFSAELWGGNVVDLGSNAFLEMGIGVSRKFLDPGVVVVLAGVNLSLSF